MFGDCFTNRPAASGTPFPEIKASIDWQYAIAAARKVMRYCANSSLAAACAPPRLAIPRLAIGAVGASARRRVRRNEQPVDPLDRPVRRQGLLDQPPSPARVRGDDDRVPVAGEGQRAAGP